MPKEIYTDLVELDKEYGDGVEVIAEMASNPLSKILASIKYLGVVSMYEGSLKKGLIISMHELRHSLGDRGGGKIGVIRDPVSQEPISWFYQPVGDRTAQERAKIASSVGFQNMSQTDEKTYTKAMEEIKKGQTSKT